MKRVVVIGLGYVGSATAIAIANSRQKYLVYGLDQKNLLGIKRINSLNNCRFPFQTNDVKLKNALKKAVKLKKNFFSLYDKNIISDADIVLVNINFDILKKKK